MSGNLLAIDVGNTRTKFGRFSLPENDSDDTVCEKFLAVPHGEPIPWQALESWVSQASPPVLAGSHPGRLEDLSQDMRGRGWSTPWTLTDRAAIPLVIDVDVPEKVGMDRLLNAVAANALRPKDRAALVIDTGTAAHVDLVTADGRFCGGAILPGFALSAQALHHYTALLPLLSVRELAQQPPAALGRNTADAIRSGIYWGQVGALKELVIQICRQQSLPAPAFDTASHDRQSPWLILTGGGAPFLEPVFPGIPQVPSLALHGLVLIARQRGIGRGATA